MLTEPKKKTVKIPRIKPLCPVHGVPMYSRSVVNKKIRYSYCPIPGCTESHKGIIENRNRPE